MIEKIKGIASDLLGKPVENFEKHLTKWVSHTRMGGLITYRETDCTELGQLKAKYETHCPVKKEDSQSLIEGNALTLLDTDKEGIPLAKGHEIYMSFNFDDKKNKGCLKKAMSSLSKLIKATVNARLQAFEAQGYNQINGAALLFCAEFAQWANSTAKRAADKDLENELKERLDYLSALEEEHVFKNEPKADYSINLLIFNLQQILEKSALPTLQALLNLEASRELFKFLSDNASEFYRNATAGLFYLYTKETECQDIFDLEHADMIVGTAKDKLLESLLGKQFQRLEEAHQKSLHFYERKSQQKSLSDHPFLDEEGKPSAPLTAEFILGNSGIHTVLENKTRVVRHLLSGLGLIQEFMIFISAFKQGFELAGAGGDILMYIGLCRQTTQLIQCYCEIHQRLMDNFAQIFKAADEIKYELMTEQKYDHPWLKTAQRGRRYLKQAQDNLIGCYEALQRMAIQMQKVHSRDYQEKIKKQIVWFENIIEMIGQRFSKKTIEVSSVVEIEAENQPLALPVIPTQSLEQRREEALRRTEQLTGIQFFAQTTTSTSSHTANAGSVFRSSGNP